VLVLLFTIIFSTAQAMTFPKKTITFDNGVTLKVEMATTPQQKEHGLMGRTSLSMNEGMLFVFQPAQPLSFWMKNTLISLSIGFFRENKTLFEIKDMEPIHGPVREELLPRYLSSEPAMYALEVPKGWFLKYKIKPGMKFRLK
jgi:uncharacterized membrane protein (UPF0127 family)